ncbi:MAG: hypothetical protein BYD32DRAFT_429313 [Podila humilis]|nr:MAG: hypothetical protein BYD32DRAFT_429313 [Podila humilis]
MVTRKRIPTPLSIAEKARARQELTAWRSSTYLIDFHPHGRGTQELVLPDAALTDLLSSGHLINNPDSISNLLGEFICDAWFPLNHSYNIQIFDILFPAAAPVPRVILAQVDPFVLQRAKRQIRRTLTNWRKQTYLVDYNITPPRYWEPVECEQAVMPDYILDAFAERFTEITNADSLFPITGWLSEMKRQSLEVVELMKPFVTECMLEQTPGAQNVVPPPEVPTTRTTRTTTIFSPFVPAAVRAANALSSSPQPTPSSSSSSSPPSAPQANKKPASPKKKVTTSNNLPQITAKELVMKKLRFWRCQVFKKDFYTHDTLFNVEVVVPDSVLMRLVDLGGIVISPGTILEVVPWRPKRLHYLQQVFDILQGNEPKPDFGEA